MRATAILGARAEVVHPAEGAFDLSAYDDVVAAILAVLARHPMREQELLQTLHRWAPEEAQAALARLERSGEIQVVARYGQRFWSLASARYAGK